MSREPGRGFAERMDCRGARRQRMRHGAHEAKAVGPQSASRPARELPEGANRLSGGSRAARPRLKHGRAGFRSAEGFSAACETGDAPGCEAVDTRFPRPHYLGTTPVPHLPGAVFRGQPSGTWQVTCQFTREGKVTACRVDEENPRVEPAMLDWNPAGPLECPDARRPSFRLRVQAVAHMVAFVTAIGVPDGASTAPRAETSLTNSAAKRSTAPQSVYS